MANRTERPTLLIFTRGADSETRRRRLLPQRLAAVERAVHQRCVDATVAAGRAAGCAIAVSSPAGSAAGGAASGCHRLPQRGRGFGARLRAAMRQVHALSSGPVVVVGTDTPGLAATHLRAAIDRLEREPDSVVVGPAPDGGIYLLASRRPLDEILADVPWRRRETIDQLLAALAAAGLEVTLLEPLADLDRPQDLARWASRSADEGWDALIDLVRRALAALARLAVPAELGRPRGLATVLPAGRAPPLSL